MFSMQYFLKKHKHFLQTYLYLVWHFLVICRVSSLFRNFPTVLALDFPQLLNRLKFHINIEQDLKNLLKTWGLEDEAASFNNKWEEFRNTNWFLLFHFHNYPKLSIFVIVNENSKFRSQNEMGTVYVYRRQ